VPHPDRNRLDFRRRNQAASARRVVVLAEEEEEAVKNYFLTLDLFALL
jgi:hypothetical protein